MSVSYVCAGICENVYMCLWRLEVNLGVIPKVPSTLFFETVSLCWPGAH